MWIAWSLSPLLSVASQKLVEKHVSLVTENNTLQLHLSCLSLLLLPHLLLLLLLRAQSNKTIDLATSHLSCTHSTDSTQVTSNFLSSCDCHSSLPVHLPIFNSSSHVHRNHLHWFRVSWVHLFTRFFLSLSRPFSCKHLSDHSFFTQEDKFFATTLRIDFTSQERHSSTLIEKMYDGNDPWRIWCRISCYLSITLTEETSSFLTTNWRWIIFDWVWNVSKSPLLPRHVDRNVTVIDATPSLWGQHVLLTNCAVDAEQARKEKVTLHPSWSFSLPNAK